MADTEAPDRGDVLSLDGRDVISTVRSGKSHHGLEGHYVLVAVESPAEGEVIRELVAEAKGRLRGEHAAVRDVAKALFPERTTRLSAGMLLQIERNVSVLASVGREFGLLSSREVGKLARSGSKNEHALANRWRADGKVFATTVEGKPLYPGFQFDQVDGRPRAVVAEVIKALGPDADGWTLAVWFVSANARLDDARPVDVMVTAPAAVVAAAAADSTPSGA